MIKIGIGIGLGGSSLWTKPDAPPPVSPPPPPVDTTAPTVTASVPTGTYNSTQTVALSANETATIYYTLDGTTPTAASTVYSAQISISSTTTLKFFGRDTVGNDSAVQTVTYTISIPPPTGLFSDNFNRGDGPLGANWIGQEGVMAISGGKAVATVSGGFNSATHDVGQANVTIRAKIKSLAGTSNGMIVFRLKDSTHYLFVEVSPSDIMLTLRNSGTAAISTTPITYVDNAEVRVDADGTTIRLWYNGVLVHTDTGVDNSLTIYTQHGISTWSVGAEIDDFVVGNVEA